MNLHTENFFKAVEAKLPKSDLISSKDLVKSGIVKCANTLGLWRSKGQGPSFIRISKGQVRYLRASVLDWLRTRIKGGEVT